MSTPEDKLKRRQKRDALLAAGLPQKTPGRNGRELERRSTPEAKAKAKERAKRRRKYGRGHCQEIMLTGRRCPNGQYVIEKEIDGKIRIFRAKWCFAHIPTEFRERWGVGEFQPTERKGRPRKPTPNTVLKELIENEMQEWLAPIRDALLAMKPIVAGNGRHARIEWAPDHRTRLQAVESALDRVYGKPKITTDVTAMMNLNADVKVPVDKDREKEVAQILLESGAIAMAAAPMNPASQN